MGDEGLDSPGGARVEEATRPLGLIESAGRLSESWYRAFLLASRRILSTSALDEVVVEAFAPLAAALPADAVALLVASDDGSTLVGQAVYRFPDPHRTAVRISAGEGMSGKVLARAEPYVADDLATEGPAGARLYDYGFRSYVGVPLVAGSRVVGVLLATSCTPGCFSEEHAEALSTVAGPMAAAVERVNLLSAERTARQRAERNAHRLAALHGLAVRLAGAQHLEEICHTVLVEGVEVVFPDAPRRIWECQGAALQLAAGVGAFGGQAVMAAADHPVAEAAVSGGEPLFFSSAESLAGLWPSAAAEGVGALAAVPLRAGRRIVGLLEIHLPEAHRFSRAERSYLLSVGVLAGASMARAEAAEEERQAAAREAERARTLITAVTPARVPRINGLELYGRYHPADAGAVGGDWYDVFALPDGRAAIVVGDVAGHGLDAVTAMVVLRHALFAFAHESSSPAEVLGRLHGLVSDASGNWPELVTVGVGFCDAGEGVLTTASAGHVPFARVGARGAEYFHALDPPLSRGVPLSGFREQAVRFEPGELAVFYTDGLIEVRGEVLSDGFDRLAAVASAHHLAPLPALAEAILEGTAAAARHDDVSLLLVRFTGRPPD